MQIYSAPVMIRKRDIVGTDVVHGSRSRARKMRSKVTQLWKRSRSHSAEKCAAATGVGLHISRTAHVSILVLWKLYPTGCRKS